MPATLAPLYPKVVITGTTDYTYDALNSVRDFQLNKLFLEQTGEGKSDRFQMVIDDNDAVLLNTVDVADQVDISLGKTVAGTTNVFTGQITRRKVISEITNQLRYELSGSDKGERLNERIVLMNRFQRALADMVTPDTTDEGTEIGTIVEDLLTATDSYPSGEPLIKDDMKLTLDIDDTSIKVPSFTVDYKPVSDVFLELGDIAGRTHWVDEQSVFHFKAPVTSSSGILLTDDYTESSWDQTKLGYILQDEPTSFEDSIEGKDMVNRLFGIGGDEVQNDVSNSVTDGGSDTLHDNYVAVMFTPTQNIDRVKICFTRTGSPEEPLTYEIRENKETASSVSNPTGATLKVGQIAEILSATNADGYPWLTGDIGVENVQTGKPHWLILYKTIKLASSTNTYQWYHDGNVSNTIASSTNDLEDSWSVSNADKGYAFVTQWVNKVISWKDDQDSISNYYLKEDVYVNSEIRDRSTMTKLLIGMVDKLAKKKRVWTGKVSPPDTMLRKSQTARVRDSKLGLDMDMTITKLGYNFDADEAVGPLEMDVEAVGITD